MKIVLSGTYCVLTLLPNLLYACAAMNLSDKVRETLKRFVSSREGPKPGVQNAVAATARLWGPAPLDLIRALNLYRTDIFVG